MFKNTIKKFAAFGLAMVLCVPAFLTSALDFPEDKSYDSDREMGEIIAEQRGKQFVSVKSFEVPADATAEDIREFLEKFSSDEYVVVVSGEIE